MAAADGGDWDVDNGSDGKPVTFWSIGTHLLAFGTGKYSSAGLPRPIDKTNCNDMSQDGEARMSSKYFVIEVTNSS